MRDETRVGRRKQFRLLLPHTLTDFFKLPTRALKYISIPPQNLYLSYPHADFYFYFTSLYRLLFSYLAVAVAAAAAATSAMATAKL